MSFLGGVNFRFITYDLLNLAYISEFRIKLVFFASKVVVLSLPIAYLFLDMFVDRIRYHALVRIVGTLRSEPNCPVALGLVQA